MENTTNNKFTVVGLFNDKNSAECAYDALDKRGYDENDDRCFDERYNAR